MADRQLWYFAHPVGPTPAQLAAFSSSTHELRAIVAANLARARRWLRWLIEHEPDIVFVATWLPYVEVLDDLNPEHRRRGMRDQLAVIKRCDGIVLCGPRISAGMEDETQGAVDAVRAVAELVLGLEPPSSAWLAATLPHGGSVLDVGRARWAARPRIVA